MWILFCIRVLDGYRSDFNITRFKIWQHFRVFHPCQKLGVDLLRIYPFIRPNPVLFSLSLLVLAPERSTPVWENYLVFRKWVFVCFLPPFHLFSLLIPWGQNEGTCGSSSLSISFSLSLSFLSLSLPLSISVNSSISVPGGTPVLRAQPEIQKAFTLE